MTTCIKFKLAVRQSNQTPGRLLFLDELQSSGGIPFVHENEPVPCAVDCRSLAAESLLFEVSTQARARTTRQVQLELFRASFQQESTRARSHCWALEWRSGQSCLVTALFLWKAISNLNSSRDLGKSQPALQCESRSWVYTRHRNVRGADGCGMLQQRKRKNTVSAES